MSKLVKYIAGKTWQPFLKRYLSKTRHYHYKGIRLQIAPGVFHPGFFFSTKLILHHISLINLQNKKILELGAGSGLISLFAAKRGAIVTATDISKTAIENLKRNAEANGLQIDIIHSDLFAQLHQKAFDMILINPPYYRRDPVSESDHAWYCGEQGEYFRKMFSELNDYFNETGEAIMVLSEDCDLEMIGLYARENACKMEKVLSRKNIFETNYLYRIRKTA